ncbi:MAG: efflux RND transporter permease subunit, partial [Chitinophagia bacterium]|nr:efflux RND transporter permease subunit [Chitinophagia bacterium]
AKPVLAPLSTAVGEIYRYVIEPPPGMSIEKVRELQDWVVRPELRRIPGIADIVSWGGAIKEYQIRVDPTLLRKYNVSLDQVSVALGSANENAGAGSLKRGGEGLVLRSIGLFQSLDDIGNIAIKNKDGKSILIKDIGEVAIGQKTRSGIVQKKLPEGVHIKMIYDRTHLVDHTVKTVQENMIMGAILVIAILMIFLQSTVAAIIVASVIPLSLLFAFLFIHLRGISANLISLGAIDFGIIVDGAVVLVEALMVRLALGKLDGNSYHLTPSWRMQTLHNTAEEMGHPILFSKAIIILAFLPIFTFQRVEGKIFTPMTYTLSFAILGAVILTFTLMPTLLSFAIKKYDLSEKHSSWMESLQTKYKNFLSKTFDLAMPILIISVGLLLTSLLLGSRLGSEFLPKLDEGNIWLTIDLPQAANLETTKEVERDIRKILLTYPEVKSAITHVGRPDDGTDPKGPNHLEILAELTSHDTWHFKTKEALISDMTKKI